MFVLGRFMKLFVCCLMFIVAFSGQFCLAKDTKDSNKIIIIKGFQAPHAISNNQNQIYVSNGGIYDNKIKKESGYISKLDRLGKIIEQKFIDNLNNPMGIAISNNIIYIADIDSIKAFSLASKKQILNIQIKGAMSLCDIVVNGDVLFVSDSKAGLIYSVDIKKKSYHVLVAIESSLGHPNGMALFNKFLYVATSDSTRFGTTLKGSVFRIDLESQSVYLISSYKHDLYGLESTPNGIIVGGYDSNDKRARFYQVTNDSKIYEIDLGLDLQNVSLFAYDNNALWIPDSKLNKIFKVMP